jgi:hypothetical protein
LKKAGFKSGPESSLDFKKPGPGRTGFYFSKKAEFRARPDFKKYSRAGLDCKPGSGLTALIRTIITDK